MPEEERVRRSREYAERYPSATGTRQMYGGVVADAEDELRAKTGLIPGCMKHDERMTLSVGGERIELEWIGGEWVRSA